MATAAVEVIKKSSRMPFSVDFRLKFFFTDVSPNFHFVFSKKNKPLIVL